MSDTTIVIMSRYPQLGKVKTRLATHIGDEQALHLYRAFLLDLAERFTNWHYDLHWAYTPASCDFEGYIASLLPANSNHGKSFPQVDDSFNERLWQVFFETQAQQYGHTIVIGSDSPHISRDIVEQARQTLEVADVVLGPADDGGYYLIAMKEPHDVFTGIPMSTNVVLEMTIAKSQQQGLRVQLLETLSDVDEITDMQRLATLLQQEPQRAPRTTACLAQLQKELV